MDRGSIRAEVAALVRTAARAPGTPFPGGADDAEIAALQESVSVPLPDELVEWLRLRKGGAIGPGGLFGVRSDDHVLDMAAALDSFPAWRERGWLPVGGDGNGDYYVLIAEGRLAGHIAFIDQSDYDKLAYIVASDVWTFVRSLLIADAGDRRWPFDRDHVLTLDPPMADVPAELQPRASVNRERHRKDRTINQT